MTKEKKKSYLVMWNIVCLLKTGYKNPKWKLSKKPSCVTEYITKIKSYQKSYLSQLAGSLKHILYYTV